MGSYTVTFIRLLELLPQAGSWKKKKKVGSSCLSKFKHQALKSSTSSRNLGDLFEAAPTFFLPVLQRWKLPAGILFFGASWNLSRLSAALLAVLLRSWALVVFFLSFWLCAVMLLSTTGGGGRGGRGGGRGGGCLGVLEEVPFGQAERRHSFYQVFRGFFYLFFKDLGI